MRGTESLSIAMSAVGSDCRLILSGELDISTAPKLEATTRRVCARRPRELEIDIRGLTFIDAAGVRSILAAKAMCAEHFSQFFVVGNETPHRRLFEVAGVYDGLPWRVAA
jgi:anti-anti-sigma factor